MAEPLETELVVLGAGPGGYAAAFLAADKGMKVTLIDSLEKPGGACLYVGCIPSKALLHLARLITDVRDAAPWGVHFNPPKIDLPSLRNQVAKVVDTLGKNLAMLCKSRKVEYVRSRGSFVDSRTLGLEDGSQRRFKHCIIAVGSSPIMLPSLALQSPRVTDSTAA